MDQTKVTQRITADNGKLRFAVDLGKELGGELRRGER